MKKRNCRKTTEEREVHDFSVKIRKMTDRQLYEFINGNSKENNRMPDFLERLETSNIPGIGPATIKKIKAFAINEGFAEE